MELSKTSRTDTNFDLGPHVWCTKSISDSLENMSQFLHMKVIKVITNQQLYTSFIPKYCYVRPGPPSPRPVSAATFACIFLLAAKIISSRLFCSKAWRSLLF